MNQGPWIFLGALVALAASWFGFVAQPQLQLGGASLQTNAVTKVDLYPQARPGLARRGLQVYRSLGCNRCHSQQVRQAGVAFDVVLTKAGTNTVEVVEALRKIRPGLSGPEAGRLVVGAPLTVLSRVDQATAATAAKALGVGGAEARVMLQALGPDIARGWGLGRSVAADFLYDQPVMLGSQRLGPDLANVGLRMPSASWHYQHLYRPRAVVPGSTMPPYPFLFERRPGGPVREAAAPLPSWPGAATPAGGATNAGVFAAVLTGGVVATNGDEVVVATDDARALVAYLLSLRADIPLFERPIAAVPELTPARAPVPGAAGGGATNVPTR